MQRMAVPMTQTFKLNGERITRTYTAEISTEIIQDAKKSYTAVGTEFCLTFFGMHDNKLHYTLETLKRFLLNKKCSAIKKLNKAQTIALQVARINDILELQAHKSLALDRINNTEAIRKQWSDIKASLLQEFPDLKTMTKDLDWQLQEENIQQVFIEDNFLNFLFSSIFYREFDSNHPIADQKILSNAMGNLSIPIIETKRITGQRKQRMTTPDITITLDATLDTDNKKFPLAKLNRFLGTLTQPGEQHQLDFEYTGTYTLQPERGLVTQGNLTYTFEAVSYTHLTLPTIYSV